MKRSGSSGKKCKSRTRKGTPCQALSGPSGYCFLHSHPQRAADVGRKGGRSRQRIVEPDETVTIPAPKTAEDIRTILGQVISDLRGRRLDTKIASTIAYVANVQLRAVEVANLEQRVKMLESAEECQRQFKGRSEQELDFFAVNGYWPDPPATIIPEEPRDPKSPN